MHAPGPYLGARIVLMNPAGIDKALAEAEERLKATGDDCERVSEPPDAFFENVEDARAAALKIVERAAGLGLYAELAEEPDGASGTVYNGERGFSPAVRLLKQEE